MGHAEKDYYTILGIARTATDRELRDAFRQLARQNHPLIKPDDRAAAARYQDLLEAYDVLSDPERRRLYDALGPH